MASKELSLVARYDDLLRTIQPLLTSHEQDWLGFLDNEIIIRSDIRNKNDLVDRLKKELNQESKERKRLELTLAQARRELEAEMLERRRMQRENDNLMRQMQVIKEIVGNKNNTSYNMLSEEEKRRLAFLNSSHHYSHTGAGGSPSMMDTALLDDASLSLLSESEYDKTGDDMLAMQQRRRSKRKSQQNRSHTDIQYPESTLKRYSTIPTAPPESEETDGSTGAAAKKTKYRQEVVAGSTSDEMTTETDDSTKIHQTHQSRHEVKLRRSSRHKMKRSLSVGDPIDQEDPVDSDSFFDIETGRQLPVSSTAPKSILKKSAVDSPPIALSPDSPTIKRWASASKLNRVHNLFQKNIVKPETCGPCGKRIKFGRQAFKCKECKLATHIECKDKLVSLCIPSDSTPSKGSQGNRIADFCPPSRPFVPAIVLQCVNEVESRGLSEEGIYRKSGSEREVKELKDRFFRGKDPKLENIIDIHVVCGCLKDFLRNLKEPLIPTSLWTSFVNAAKIQEDSLRAESIRGAVKLLPCVNRDTIALLIIHLQKVSERPDTKMGVDNLSKVFGPTIVGYSIPCPQPMQMISETRPQQIVMTSLLELDVEYWTDLLGGNAGEITSLDYDLMHTPNRNSNELQDVPKSSAKVKKFFGESPRYPVLARNGQKFFPSPQLK